MHLDVDKDVCLPNANIVDILFSVLVFWFEIYKMLIRGSI